MRLAIIADVFPPLRSSGAVQLRDLSVEFARQGHETTVMVASPELSEPWKIEQFDSVEVVRLKTPRTKDTGYTRRALAEFLLPFAMIYQLRKTPLRNVHWDGVIWYSPTIFLGPMVKWLKSNSGCNSYLIIRDIFPEWAVDMGLMKKGLSYFFFKSIANYQYKVADLIGVQSPGNKSYFNKSPKKSNCHLQVLQNWLSWRPDIGCQINLSNTPLRGKKIFVYAGNIGVAQGVDILLELANEMRERTDVGFVFVGRGSEIGRLRKIVKNIGMSNVLFFDEIDPDEIPGLYSQCHVGLVSLDFKHKSHNIPGKFLSYMQAGLPVLAIINPGNDLIDLIESRQVGKVCSRNSVIELQKKADLLLEELDTCPDISSKCISLWSQSFSTEAAVKQITSSFRGKLGSKPLV